MTITSAVDIETLAEGTIQKIHLGPKLMLPTDQVIDIIHALKQFELGRTFLSLGLITSSLVDYICHNEVSPTGNEFETWFLSKAPRMKALKERYHITKDQLQFYLRSNMSMGILPCGVISKVAELDYSQVENVRIIGYDRDIQGLVNAEKQMMPYVTAGIVDLILMKRDLWLLDEEDQYDLMLSNRVSVLERNSTKVLDLFKKFYAALKPNGILLTSFFTPSPLDSLEDSPWVNTDPNDTLIEDCIFRHIMEFTFPPRTEAEVRQLVTSAGFKVLDILNDSSCIYPTVVAQKV